MINNEHRVFSSNECSSPVGDHTGFLLLWPTHASVLEYTKQSQSQHSEMKLSLEVAVWPSYDFCIIFFLKFYLFLIIENMAFFN